MSVEMSVQPSQLINLIVLAIVAIGVYKFKNYYIKSTFLLLIVVMFFVNPVRFKQEGMSRLEYEKYSKFDSIPEKVVVESKSFEQRQKESLSNLKQQSQELKR